MTTPMSATAVTIPAEIRICVSGPNGVSQEHVLPPGDALVIGSSPACGARIEGSGVAAMHCTISSEEGQIVIDDWDTGAGTRVDGQRIARQAIVQPGAVIEIGDYRLEICAADESAELDERHDPPFREPVDPHMEPEPSGISSAFNRVAEPDAEEHSSDPSDEIATSEQSIWDSPVSAFAGTDAVKPTDSQAVSNEPAYEVPVTDGHGDGLLDDTSELLRIELDFLRTELADRDARVAELELALDNGPGHHDDDLPSREEIEALAGRLEELLEELDQSDERLKTMSEMLRLSEEANVASEEERAQMESWIGEVERRVGSWEEEWHAERDTLNRQIAEVTAQRDEAESLGTNRESAELIQQLRHQITSLEADVTRLQSERDDVQQRMETAQVQSVEDRIAEAVDAAMREERLQLSQERAECARERADLMRQQEEVASRERSHSTADIADLKIRAFREHLKEIRENDPNPRPAPSMSQRLGKLWRKIDGRPLDTD